MNWPGSNGNLRTTTSLRTKSPSLAWMDRSPSDGFSGQSRSCPENGEDWCYGTRGRARVRRKLWNVGKWLLGAGLVVGVCWLNREKFAKIATQWDQFEPWHLVLAGLVFFIGTLMTFWRWLILVRAQELPFRYVDSVRLGFI